jgi:hypothetical protein
MEHQSISSEQYEQLKRQLDNQDVKIGEIRDALLGSLTQRGGGLLEAHRQLRSDVDNVLTTQRTNITQITELMTFKSNIKKLVTGIAIAIPFAFELIKFVFELVWDWLKSPLPPQ